MIELTNSIHVLHVDDEPGLTDQLTAFIEQSDFDIDITTAITVNEGVECLSRHAIDCIIADYDLPDQTGLEFLKTVRENHADLPFILYTAKGNEEIASEAISVGVTDYMQKSRDTNQYAVLCKRVKNAVDHFRASVEREEYEQKLKQKTRQLQGVLDSVKAAIWMRDTKSRFMLTNQNFTDLFGLTEHDDIIDKRPEEIFSSDIATQFNENDRRVLRKQEPIELEEDVPTQFGTRTFLTRITPLFDDAGAVYATCGIATDITHRKEHEQELTYRKSLFEAVLETTVDGILVTTQDWEILTANERFREIWGLPAEVIESESGREALEMVLDQLENPSDFVNRFADLYDNPAEKSRDQIHLTDGRTLDRYSSPVTDANGTSYGRLWVYRDVTDRMTRERELEQQNEQLEEFASVVSHDLRNPLTVAQGNVELLWEQYDDDHLEAVDRSLCRMDELIDDILTLARNDAEPLDIEILDLAELPHRCWSMFVETDDATLLVDTDIKIHADEGRLCQLFENLFRNSIEHGGPAVTVRIGGLDDGFYVEDDGPGVPVEDYGRVFEHGYSTSETGTGFGLSIVQKIAKAHEWDVTITDGSTGGFRLEVHGVSVVTGNWLSGT